MASLEESSAAGSSSSSPDPSSTKDVSSMSSSEVQKYRESLDAVKKAYNPVLQTLHTFAQAKDEAKEAMVDKCAKKLEQQTQALQTQLRSLDATSDSEILELAKQHLSEFESIDSRSKLALKSKSFSEFPRLIEKRKRELLAIYKEKKKAEASAAS